MFGSFVWRREATPRPYHVFEDSSGRRNFLVRGVLVIVLVMIAFLGVDFVNRLGAIAPAIAVAGQMELEGSIRTVSSASSTSPTVFQLNAGAGPNCESGREASQTLDRPVVVFVASGDSGVAGAFARRCGEIDLLLSQSMSLDAVSDDVAALPQQVLPLLAGTEGAPPFFTS